MIIKKKLLIFWKSNSMLFIQINYANVQNLLQLFFYLTYIASADNLWSINVTENIKQEFVTIDNKKIHVFVVKDKYL